MTTVMLFCVCTDCGRRFRTSDPQYDVARPRSYTCPTCGEGNAEVIRVEQVDAEGLKGVKT